MKPVVWVVATVCVCGAVSGPSLATANTNGVSGIVRAQAGQQIAQISPALAMAAHLAVAKDEPQRAESTVNAVAFRGLTRRPSLFMTSDKAGYGWRTAGTQTTFGLYGLPAGPDLHSPSLAPAGKSAAGVSFSVDLGR